MYSDKISDKFVFKYMRLAKQFGEDNNPCLSRHIGTVIVDPIANNVIGMGYNGPPPGIPHCDTKDHLRDIVWPQLTDDEKITAKGHYYNDTKVVAKLDGDTFADHFAGCGKCPRRLVDAPTSKRLELCSCEHAEKNAIYNATQSLVGSYMFCWCGVPCWDCCKAIVRAKISRVYFTDWGADYSSTSRWMLKKASIEIIGLDPDRIINDESCSEDSNSTS